MFHKVAPGRFAFYFTCLSASLCFPVYLSHTLHTTNTKVWTLGRTSSCWLLRSLQAVHLLDWLNRKRTALSSGFQTRVQKQEQLEEFKLLQVAANTEIVQKTIGMFPRKLCGIGKRWRAQILISFYKLRTWILKEILQIPVNQIFLFLL